MRILLVKQTPKNQATWPMLKHVAPQANQATTQYMQQQPQHTPTAQYFLEIIQQIQTWLKMIETAQQGQASQIQAIITPQRTQAEITPKATRPNIF